jgi:hypothetical protein
MLRSEIITIIQEHIERYGDGDAYAIVTNEPGSCWGTNIKDIGLDADNNTVIDATMQWKITTL